VEAYRVVRVKDPTLSRQSAHIWWQDFQSYAPAALYSETFFFSVWYSFLLQAE
jgi:fumarate reductase subunit C